VHAVTEGIDAQGEVTVRIEESPPPEGLGEETLVDARRTFGGYGADTDIIVASAKAYLAAINKMLAMKTAYRDGQHASAIGMTEVDDRLPSPLA
jgi:2-isopropylmalate synthase